MIFIMVVVIFSIVIYTKHVTLIFFLNGAFTPIFLVMPESHNSCSGHCEAALPKN